MTDIQSQLVRTLSSRRSASRWLVAFSGGVDSHVLLHALASWHKQSCSQSPDQFPPIHVVHVNHQMQAQANDWQRHCEEVCRELQLPLEVLQVSVTPQGEGWEAAARHARYGAFRRLMGQGDLLLMAHHADDQIETLLMRLLRGSGMRGLSAMPGGRLLGAGQLLRPLLSVSRADIEHYAHEQGLRWVEDPSNRNARYDRNFLRHRLLPLLAERWPDFRQPLLRAVEFSAQSERLLRQLAEQDMQEQGYGLDQPLPVALLVGLSAERRDNLLRFWLQAWGVAGPSAVQLAQIIADVVQAREDASPEFRLGDRQLRRYRNALQVTALDDLSPTGSHAWDPASVMHIPGGGCLKARPVSGGGLRPADHLELRFRQGGERCRPAGRAHSQSLKKLLQEWGLEPWWRDRVPLLYCGEELVAVADLWVCEGWVAGPDEPGWALDWQRPGVVQPEFVIE